MGSQLNKILEQLNTKFSLIGDPTGFNLEALKLKLIASEQDSSILAEISDSEMDVLEMEVRAARNAKEYNCATPF